MLQTKNWHTYWADYKLIYDKNLSSPYLPSKGHDGTKKDNATLASRDFKTFRLIYHVFWEKNPDQKREVRDRVKK